VKCATVSADQNDAFGMVDGGREGQRGEIANAGHRQSVGTGLRVGVAVGRGGGADGFGRRFCSEALASEALASEAFNDPGHLFLARPEQIDSVDMVAGHLLLADLELLDCLPEGCEIARHRLEQHWAGSYGYDGLIRQEPKRADRSNESGSAECG